MGKDCANCVSRERKQSWKWDRAYVEFIKWRRTVHTSHGTGIRSPTVLQKMSCARRRVGRSETSLFFTSFPLKRAHFFPDIYFSDIYLLWYSRKAEDWIAGAEGIECIESIEHGV